MPSWVASRERSSVSRCRRVFFGLTGLPRRGGATSGTRRSGGKRVPRRWARREGSISHQPVSPTRQRGMTVNLRWRVGLTMQMHLVPAVAAAVAAATALLARLGLVNGQGAAFGLLAVQGGDGGLSFLGG